MVVYVALDPEEAVRDFMLRIQHYEKVYETITEDELAYMKYIDVGRQVCGCVTAAAL